MNEPKKSEIESAVRDKWPTVHAISINHRQHTMRLTFINERKRPVHTTLRAESQRKLLEKLIAA